jgi:hypothetical protein
MHHTLSPTKTLMPHPNPTTFPTTTGTGQHTRLPNRARPAAAAALPGCLVQLKIARNAPRLLGFAI